MAYYFVYPIVYFVLWFTALILGRVTSSSRENVPKTGGLIYCPNHVSDADPVVTLVTIPRRAWFIGKEELFRPRFAGWLFRAMHGFPIKRDSADRAALRRAEDLLKRGEAIVLFPEGRCSQSGRLQRMQPGAALLALRAGVPIVPIGLRHTNNLLPYGSLMPRFSRDQVTAEYGKPIYPSEFDDLPKGDRINAMTDRLGKEIAKLIGQDPPATDVE